MGTVDQVFTSEQVMRLTGVTRRRLNYWLEREILSADVDAARGRGRVRLWSFSNLIEVRVALALRDDVSLQLLRKIVSKLRERGLTLPLAEVRVAVLQLGHGSRVVVQDPDGSLVEPLSGQGVMELVLPLDQYEREITEAAALDRDHERQPGRVVQRRGRLGSTPVFAGTRIPVAAVRRLQSAGWEAERIIAEYPGLTEADLRVAADDAAKAV
jgi:uncharacterized protein (DUF433 family)